MPDVVTLLNQDHRKVERLFTEFENSRRWEIVMQICDELDIHMQLEEELVYPQLANLDGEMEQEAEDEHNSARGLIDQLKREGSDSFRLVELVGELKGAITHHVKEEESDAWPRLRDGLGQDRLDELGTKVTMRKQQLLGDASGTSTSAASSDGRGRMLIDLTKEELYEKAKQADIEGRSSMTKKQLVEALQERG